MVVGAFLVYLPLNSGVSVADALNGYKYTQTSMYGRILAYDGFGELSAKERSSRFEKNGGYDKNQTVDIAEAKQEEGIYAKEKNPATTYTLEALETFSRSEEFSKLKSFVETEGYSEELFADITYGNFGDTYYRDDAGRLYRCV